MSAFDDLPIGTICGPGREYDAFFGQINQIPRGWVLCAGQLLTKDKHDHPTKDKWQLLDLSREFVYGGSTHIDSQMEDDGSVSSIKASNQDPPGLFTIIKVRHS